MALQHKQVILYGFWRWYGEIAYYFFFIAEALKNLTTATSNKTVTKAQKSKGTICNNLNYETVSPDYNFLYLWYSNSCWKARVWFVCSVTSSPFCPFRKSSENLDHNSSEESTSEDEVKERNSNGWNTPSERELIQRKKKGEGVFHEQDEETRRWNGNSTDRRGCGSRPN